MNTEVTVSSIVFLNHLNLRVNDTADPTCNSLKNITLTKDPKDHIADKGCNGALAPTMKPKDKILLAHTNVSDKIFTTVR